MKVVGKLRSIISNRKKCSPKIVWAFHPINFLFCFDAPSHHHPDRIHTAKLLRNLSSSCMETPQTSLTINIYPAASAILLFQGNND